MPPRYDEDGNPLYDEDGKLMPRTLKDVKVDGQKLFDDINRFGDAQQQSEALSLRTELETLVDQCLEYEATNENIASENEDNASENEKISEEIKEQEALLNEQEKEIEAQLKDLEAELEAARASTPPDEDLIAELEMMKEGLIASRQQLQADRERLFRCSEKSARVSQNCNIIRSDCAEVRQRISEACNPEGAFGLVAGAGGSDNSDEFEQGGIDFVELLLGALRAEVARMAELANYLATKIPEIQEKHDKNTELLAETKTELTEVQQNTAERSHSLSSSKEKLAAIRDKRLQNQATVHNDHKPPVVPMSKISATSQSHSQSPKQPTTSPMPGSNENRTLKN